MISSIRVDLPQRELRLAPQAPPFVDGREDCFFYEESKIIREPKRCRIP